MILLYLLLSCYHAPIAKETCEARCKEAGMEFSKLETNAPFGEEMYCRCYSVMLPNYDK